MTLKIDSSRSSVKGMPTSSALGLFVVVAGLMVAMDSISITSTVTMQFDFYVFLVFPLSLMFFLALAPPIYSQTWCSMCPTNAQPHHDQPQQLGGCAKSGHQMFCSQLSTNAYGEAASCTSFLMCQKSWNMLGKHVPWDVRAQKFPGGDSVCSVQIKCEGCADAFVYRRSQ